MKHKVLFTFESTDQRNEAINFLSSLKVGFQYFINGRCLTVSQDVFKKYDLDLYLSYKVVSSIIKF